MIREHVSMLRHMNIAPIVYFVNAKIWSAYNFKDTEQCEFEHLKF